MKYYAIVTVEVGDQGTPSMNREHFKKISKLLETQKKEKTKDINPMSERFTMPDMDPIDCIGPNSRVQSKMNFEEIHIQKCSQAFKLIQGCMEGNSARKQVKASKPEVLKRGLEFCI